MTSATPWPKLRRGLVAILRGIETSDVEMVVGGLVEEGFEAIEIPLNSPEPFRSIERAVNRFGTDTYIGAGTVLTSEDVERLHGIGARLVVSPNTDVAVIARTAQLGMLSMPGVLTPSEAFLALSSGASALKFFPALVVGPSGISAMRAVLPAGAVIGAVGGVSEKDFGVYAKVGVVTFGLGSSLYKAGDAAEAVRERARRAIRAYDDAGLSTAA